MATSDFFVGRGFSHDLRPAKSDAASQAAEKVGRFVGRGFSHDVSALDSSGVLTPEARKCHFSASAAEVLILA